MSIIIINKIQEYCIHLIPNKSLSQLLDTSPKNIIILKFLKFSCIEVWFTNKNSKLLETEDKINITLLIN